MLFVGLVTGEYSEEWVQAHFYFDVRGFYFLIRTIYFTDAVVCDMVVDTTGAAIWTTPEIAKILSR